MADIPEVVSTDPVEMLAVGRRHLAVKDYSSAVTSLGKACELLAEKYGQQADECGEAYFWYGKSLLGLAREESGVLGDGIPGGDDNQEDEEEEDDAGEEDNSETDKNGEESKTEASGEIPETNITSKDDNEASKLESMDSTNDKPNDSPTVSQSEAEPGPSTAATSSTADGEAEDNEDDEVENLQVAWEVFELARDVFLKRGERGKKELADVYLYLGEVSLESEMYDKAVTDMGKSLDLFKDLYRPDDRRIAETHYQIGLAHSLSNGFDDAISHFKSAAEILETRIKNLQTPSIAADNADIKKHLSSDPFYSIDGEIKELTELLPEIKEKVQDMIDYKAEAIRSMRETLGMGSKNGNSSKENGGTSVPQEKKALDISHLIKRKRKPEEDSNTDDCSAAKKIAN
ncbi:nuclear autoantigenic sperm protein [Arctopsyche grandis]|uniref:nuclear autoantigenic sperm protein n=1 Tax=Arctopsyche grandis TaxID=121162 RepID=UPI00406D8129